MKLLNLLADGAFHSGEEIGTLLGISRAAVWKQFKKLEPLGLPLEAQKGRGYRLQGGVDLLSAERIRALLPAAVLQCLPGFDIFHSIDSTNAAATLRAGEGGAHGYFCLAEQQTSGRGRRGRQWQSPFGRNIYLSLVWEFQSGAAALEGLSLSVGVAVARALRRWGVAEPRLKWPNDVLYDDKKLAGILLEMQGDPAGLCQVVVGIGVNLDMSRSDTAAITQPWIDLQSIVAKVDRNQFAVDLLVELYAVLEEFSADGFGHLRQQWLEMDAYRGREVFVQLGEQWINGVAAGVDASGGLVLNVAGVERVFRGGELSLRRAAP